MSEVAASNMAYMIDGVQQEFNASGIPSLRPYLNMLIANGLAEHVQVKWGKSYRWVIKIGCKSYQYNGSLDINKNLQNKISQVYIDMSNKSLNNKSKKNEKTIM